MSQVVTLAVVHLPHCLKISYYVSLQNCLVLLYVSIFTGSCSKRSKWHYHWSMPYSTPVDNHDHKLDCGIAMLYDNFFYHGWRGRYHSTSRMEARNTRVPEPDPSRWISR